MYRQHLAAFGFLTALTQSPSGYLWSPLEVEFDEATGKIGTLPEPLQKMVDGLIGQSHKTLRTQITELETKLKAGTGGGTNAAEIERLKALEDENNRFKTADLERKAEYDKALKIREEAEANREKERQKELEKASGEVKRRDERLREMARSEIKIAAKNLGARTESLDELARLLGADLDLDTDLQPFVKGTDGKPAVGADGKPVTIEGHVKAYLDTHSHHRASTGGTGGGARGGASYSGAEASAIEAAEAELEEARKELARNKTNTRAMSKVLAADKKVKELKAKAGAK